MYDQYTVLLFAFDLVSTYPIEYVKVDIGVLVHQHCLHHLALFILHRPMFLSFLVCGAWNSVISFGLLVRCC